MLEQILDLSIYHSTVSLTPSFWGWSGPGTPSSTLVKIARLGAGESEPTKLVKIKECAARCFLNITYAMKYFKIEIPTLIGSCVGSYMLLGKITLLMKPLAIKAFSLVTSNALPSLVLTVSRIAFPILTVAISIVGGVIFTMKLFKSIGSLVSSCRKLFKPYNYYLNAPPYSTAKQIFLNESNRIYQNLP